MEEICISVQHVKSVEQKHSTNQTGPSGSERRLYWGVVLSLGLLSVFLLAGLIGLGVYHHNSLEERDRLNAGLINLTKEVDRLHRLSKQKKVCPTGWKMYDCVCYFLSSESDSWDRGSQDCRDRGAHLVIIDSPEEQELLSKIFKKRFWIGLNDRDNESNWKWVDGTPLNVQYWAKNQPDNGRGDPQWGKEDCVEVTAGVRYDESWNDLRCNATLPWICEKLP